MLAKVVIDSLKSNIGTAMTFGGVASVAGGKVSEGVIGAVISLLMFGIKETFQYLRERRKQRNATN